MYLAYRFLCDFIQRIQDLHFHKSSGKNVTTAPPSKLRSQSLYQFILIFLFLKLEYCVQNFVRFQEIESEIELS